MSGCPVTGHAKLDRWVKMVASGHLHYKGIFFPFVISVKYKILL